MKVMGKVISVFAIGRAIVSDGLSIMGRGRCDRGRCDLEEVELKFDG